jgi:hypothetical protein
MFPGLEGDDPATPGVAISTYLRQSRVLAVAVKRRSSDQFTLLQTGSILILPMQVYVPSS